MITLALTTDKLSLITDFAGSVKVSVFYTDRNQSTGVVGTTNKQLTDITTATTTDVGASPGGTTTRNIKEIRIHNAHASTVMDVTLQYNANGTLYELIASRLLPGDALTYTEQFGFRLIQPEKLLDESRVIWPLQTVNSDVVCNGNVNAGPSSVPTFTVKGLKPQTTYHFMFSGVTIAAGTIGARFQVAAVQDQTGMVCGGGFAVATNSNTAAVVSAGANDFTSQSCLLVNGTGTVSPGGLHLYAGTFTTTTLGASQHVEVWIHSETSNQQVRLLQGAWLRVWQASGFVTAVV